MAINGHYCVSENRNIIIIQRVWWLQKIIIIEYTNPFIIFSLNTFESDNSARNSSAAFSNATFSSLRGGELEVLWQGVHSFQSHRVILFSRIGLDECRGASYTTCTAGQALIKYYIFIKLLTIIL